MNVGDELPGTRKFDKDSSCQTQAVCTDSPGKHGPGVTLGKRSSDLLSGFQPHTHTHLGKSGEFFGSIFTIQVVKRVSLQHKKTSPFEVSIRKGA